MEKHHIKSMAKALVRDGLISAWTAARARGVLAEYWREMYAAVWTVEDMEAACPGLDRDQARQLLGNLGKIDADVGVCWDTIYQLASGMFPGVDLCPEEEEDDQECAHPNAVLADPEDPLTMHCPDCGQNFIVGTN